VSEDVAPVPPLGVASAQRSGRFIDSHPSRRTPELRDVTGLDVTALNSRVFNPRGPWQRRPVEVRVGAVTGHVEHLTAEARGRLTSSLEPSFGEISCVKG
jgi:hypothetical protein